MRLLIIGHTWPEASTTAAGGRMLQLIRLFKDCGYHIHFASTAQKGDYASDLDGFGVSYHQITINDSGFDHWVEQLQPKVVLFDRFMTEEQFGWRVSEACPTALKILDTEDLHFLRLGRQKAVKKGVPVTEADLFTDHAKRELASIWRCDLSLIISEFEFNLLNRLFAIPRELLFYLPFLVDPDAILAPEDFSDRKDFISVGNFKHAPNLDAVIQLKALWPDIRKRIPTARLNIYGAYAPPKVAAWNDPGNGFYVEGWIDNLQAVMRSSLVHLAPLRFGAGLKGKVLDAMLVGTPTVTTSIGAEGMHGELPFAGSITNDQEAFVEEAVRLYNDKQVWTKASAAAKPILEHCFDQNLFAQDFLDRLVSLRTSLQAHRNAHFMGQVLQHNQVNALKFMSKWIEEKNK